jgi:WS/DGAT/MGAT family acyltransferase
LLAERLHRVPVLGQRLRYPMAGLLPAVWVDDPAFDLANHVMAAPVLADMTTESIAAAAAEVLRHQLPRNRPLWEISVFEAANDRRVAVIAKVHHSLLDGVAGLELFAELIDVTPESPPATTVPDQAVAAARGNPTVASLSALVQTQTRVLRRVATEMSNTRRRRTDDPASPSSLRSLIAAAPHTTMTRPVGPRRAVALASLDMDDVALVRKGIGGTINDVVLAICGGALRHYLGDDGLPVEPLVAAVPVSLRGDDNEGSRGNQLSVMLVSLATDVEDPRERLEVIRAGSERAKREQAHLPVGIVTDMISTIAPSLGARAGGALSRALGRGWPAVPCNLVVSNVPGPPFTTYLAGMEVAAIHPLGPIIDGAPLNITVLSHRNRLEVGITACPAAVPGHERLPGLLGLALDDLVAAAR